jgi:hypothetical protein
MNGAQTENREAVSTFSPVLTRSGYAGNEKRIASQPCQGCDSSIHRSHGSREARQPWALLHNRFAVGDAIRVLENQITEFRKGIDECSENP